MVSDHSETPSSDRPSEIQPEIALPEINRFHIDVLERDSYRKFCLVRLANFVKLRSNSAGETEEDTLLHHRLVDRAVYSAFRDCVSAGAEAEARHILAEASSQAA